MKLFRIICLTLLIASLLGGCSSKKAESDLPDSLSKLNRSATGPILSKDLEDRLNYQRKDREAAGYIKVDRNPVEVFSSPNSSDNKLVYDMERARIRDRKLINGKEWFYVSAIMVKNPNSLADENRVTSGWIQNNGDVTLDLRKGINYDFLRGIQIPEKLLKEGKWRLAYSTRQSEMGYHHYIDIDSITELNDNIFFRELSITEKINNKLIRADIRNYCYHVKRKMIYETDTEQLDIFDEKKGFKRFGDSTDAAFTIVKGLKSSEKWFLWPGKQNQNISYTDAHIVRLQSGKNKLAYLDTEFDPIIKNKPVLLFTAFFELLEGK